MTWDDLKGKPRFADVAADFVEFARGAEWVIHNAPFDLAFLDAEFRRAGPARLREFHAGVIDTLALARENFPGKRNNLDALCERFGVDNAHRTLHGALLDAELLAEVYLAMTRGQETLTIDLPPPTAPARRGAVRAARGRAAPGSGPPCGASRPRPRSSRRTRRTSRRSTGRSKGRCLWLQPGRWRLADQLADEPPAPVRLFASSTCHRGSGIVHGRVAAPQRRRPPPIR